MTMNSSLSLFLSSFSNAQPKKKKKGDLTTEQLAAYTVIQNETLRVKEKLEEAVRA